jgi:hypothetical protein
MAQSSRKGRLVEQVVAKLHETPGVTVQRNVRLLPKGGKGTKREIDILLTSVVAGYSIHIAIECKNEDKAIQAPAIDAFVGKLQYVGIPVQQGIFVASRGFTRGAIERAAAAGIRTFTITGLTADRLAAAVFEAFQSVVFLFLRVKEVKVTSNATECSPRIAVFTDQEGNLKGSVFDAIWLNWINRLLPMDVGEHEKEIEVPNDWGQIIDDNFERVQSLSAKMQVVALVLTHHGQYTQHALLHAPDNVVKKLNVKARFDIPELPVTLKQVESEADLQEHLKSFSGLRIVTGRFLLPRIDAFNIFGYMFWPPSEKSIEKIKMAVHGQKNTGYVDPNLFGGEPIDSRNIDSIFDPIWSAYQFIGQDYKSGDGGD